MPQMPSPATPRFSRISDFANTATGPTICLLDLPSGPSVSFKESAFFSRNGRSTSFPSLAQVLALSASQNTPEKNNTPNPGAVFFESLGLAVKFGRDRTVRNSEGQCLWALRHYLPGFPVPEIYGWSTDDGYVLLYMAIVIGVTVEKRWTSMTGEEKHGFAREMKDAVSRLRTLRQDPGDQFLGQINRDGYRDRSITHDYKPAPPPFLSVKDFHDWLSRMVAWQMEERHPDPWREELPDSATICFTHADLHPSNIMVDDGSPSKVAAIIDWEQSGWYPDYWEFCKAEWTAEYGSDWYQHMVMFLEEPAAIQVFNDYTRAYGG